jgi:hypothetical protein
VFLFVQLTGYGQIDPKKLDSLSRLIDSSAKAYKRQQDTIIKVQESTYRLEANKPPQQNPYAVDDSVAEQRRKERQANTIRIVIGVLLLVSLVVVLLRKKKLRS